MLRRRQRTCLLPVVQQVAITPAYHAFDENHIRNLANSLPLLIRSEKGCIAPRNQPTRIFEIENRDAGSIDQLVVGAVVNQNDPLFCHDGSRARFSDAGIKLSRAHGQNGRVSGLSPMNQVGGVSQSGLILIVRTRPKKYIQYLPPIFCGTIAQDLVQRTFQCPLYAGKITPLRSQRTRSFDVARQSCASFLL